MLSATMQCDTIQYKAIQYNAVWYNAIIGENVILYETMRCYTEYCESCLETAGDCRQMLYNVGFYECHLRTNLYRLTAGEASSTGLHWSH